MNLKDSGALGIDVQKGAFDDNVTVFPIGAHITFTLDCATTTLILGGALVYASRNGEGAK